MLIADTGPLVAMLNAKDKHHETCTALFRRFRGPIIVPAPIVTEVAYFLQIEPGPAVEAAFLDALARGELIVEATTAQGFARMADLVRQYADFPLGTADASVIAVAERLGATHVATIDHRHFRAIRPAHCAAFELLPALCALNPELVTDSADRASLAMAGTADGWTAIDGRFDPPS